MSDEASRADRRFLPKYRLRHSVEFKRAYDRRASAADGCLLVFGCKNAMGYPRLGLSVSRKVGPAVTRNRWKRAIREAFRTRRTRLPSGIDLVVVPRAALPPSAEALAASLERLALRVGRKVASDP